MKELLTSTLMHQLSIHRFRSKKMKRTHYKGGRQSTKLGASLEFSDYRSYQPGDDPRQIDWNVYARTNKHYIKRFLDEQELVLSIYVDCSKSMSSIPEKWKLAKGLTAALGYMSLTSDDRVGIIPVGAENHPFLYKKGRIFANRLIHYLDLLEPTEKLSTFSEAIGKMIQPKSSVTIVISDLLEPAEKIEEALKKVQAYKQELYVIQVLTEEEINPFYQGDIQLIDSETNEFLHVTMSTSVKKQYRTRLKNHTEQIQKFCHSRGIAFLQCQTNQSLEEILFKTLTSKGWIQ